jgi:EAL domain-containing protein (putative c-di-GMP-specific phosphodiesterase class I)
LGLKRLGVRLSIDDFGTGYSSLSYLRRFPIDTLKIDRSFISHIDDHEENRQIVRTIMHLAANLGMDVIAEGAETPQEIDHLKELHCEYVQGYYFFRPLDQLGVETLLSS